jgi:isoquinoline 1-oxidoreductase subunit beta
MTTNTMTKASLSRRGFMIGTATAGGGLALGFRIGGIDVAGGGIAPALAQKADANAAAECGVWVAIKPNDDITVRMARTEMGQGTGTGLAQLIMEELEGDWSRVKWEYVTPGQSHAKKRAWGDFGTGGSRGVRESHLYVRQGGAVARQLLIQAAAEQWKVPASECKAENSVITHPSGKKTTYGKVAAAASKLAVPDAEAIKKIVLKDPKSWKIAGKPLARLDTKDKLVGKQIYTMDLKLPGMLNAAIKDAPVFKTKIKSFDDSKAKAMPGVKKVVKVGDSAVAVIADTWWRANKALQAVTVVYEDSALMKVNQADILKGLDEGLTAASSPEKGVFVGNKQGDIAKSLSGAAKKIEATYYTPFVNHACMEAMTAAAKYTADKCEVWCGTQNGEGSHAAASEASGLPLDKCEVYKQFPGSGFGRRGASQDYVTQAVLIAKEMPGTPIKLTWSREEDMQHGFYRPIGKCQLTAALDEQGNFDGLKMRISAASILTTVAPQRLGKDGADLTAFQGLNPGGTEGPWGYTGIPNLLIEHAMRNSHVPIGFWRGVNNNQNAVFVECFMEEVAKALGKDPLKFRQDLLAKSPKHLAVLNAVAEAGGYGKPLPPGVFRGISQMAGYGSYVAGLAEVSVSDRGRLKVHRLVIGTNCGHVVNPDQVKCQIEGSVAYGLGAMLYQENTIKNGAMVEGNFDTFGALRIDEMPKVESVLVPTNDFWGGVGEPTIMVAAPAVLNGIFHATGKMQRSMPLKNAKLREA